MGVAGGGLRSYLYTLCFSFSDIGVYMASHTFLVVMFAKQVSDEAADAAALTYLLTYL